MCVTPPSTTDSASLRISKYTQPSAERSGTKEAPASEAHVQFEPASPASTAKSAPFLDIKANNHGQEVLRHVNDKGSKAVLDAPMSASPQSTTQSQWQADGFKDPHLSGHEPRYFPGMMARASRRDSIRQGSMHDSDDIVSTRGALKRGGAKEE